MSVHSRRRKQRNMTTRFNAMPHKDRLASFHRLAEHAKEYAGMPIPLEGMKVIVHPSYRFAPVFNEAIKKAERAEAKDSEGCKLINRWVSHTNPYTEIYIWSEPDGRICGGRVPLPNRAAMMLETMGAAGAWTLEMEHRALTKLQKLIKPHLFEMYVLTGQFLESSKRSGVFYMFRRMRPTIAMSGRTGDMRILCALCLHPIGYYSGTWAGVMCPTDEVIAHLMLMRGDEADFWRQANQHPAHHPQSGL